MQSALVLFASVFIFVDLYLFISYNIKYLKSLTPAKPPRKENNRMDRKVEKRSAFWIVLLSLIGCGVMAVVDGAILPHYAVKSLLKIGLFLLLSLIHI